MLTRPAGGHCDDDDDEEEDEDGEGGRHVAPACVQPQLFGVPAWRERYIDYQRCLVIDCSVPTLNDPITLISAIPK